MTKVLAYCSELVGKVQKSELLEELTQVKCRRVKGRFVVKRPGVTRLWSYSVSNPGAPFYWASPTVKWGK